MSIFTDDDLKRLKKDLQSELYRGSQSEYEMANALLARLEAAEAIALAVENAEVARKGIDVTNKISVAFDLIEWFRMDWGNVLNKVAAWRKAVGK